jgi:hypothetical protein
MNNYNFINDSQNRAGDNREKYVQILKGWNLNSELQLHSADNKILKTISNEKKLKRVYNQSIFKDGIYNIDRYLKLKELIG